MSSSNLVKIEMFYAFYPCWNLFKFLFWSTVLMKWELFPRLWNPGKRGLGGLRTGKHGPSRPDAHSGLCKKNDLNFFSFFFFLSFDFILFSTLADGWHFKQLEAHRKYSFMQEKKKSIHLPSHSFNGSSCWWSFLCTFVNCNCVNVSVS